jgi:GTPase SAR1 family protein
VDTAGQDEYSLLSSKLALGIHGYLLVYSINSRESFELLDTIRSKILNHTGLDWVPLVLVGNKSDLLHQRQVSVEEVEAVAQKWNCVSIEVSARVNHNVQRCFELMLQEIEKQSGDSSAPVPAEPKANDCTIL